MADICFTGTDGFTQSGPERFSEAADGSLQSSRFYEGDASELASFLALWPRGQNHPEMSGLFVSDRQWEKSGGYCTVELLFSGRDGALQSDGGATLVGRTYVARSVEISTSGSGLNKYIVEYRSPSATVTWVSGVDVMEPSKESAAGLDGLSPAIISANSTEGNGAIPDATTYFTEDTEYEVKTISDGFSTQPLSDPATGTSRWNVTEVWTRVIVDKEIV